MAPSYSGVAELPRMYPPPWMKNITGSGWPSGAEPDHRGVTTLSVRQSSLIG